MARLEDITVGTSVTGISGSAPVSVVAVKWHGTNAMTVTFRNAGGNVHIPAYPDSESGFIRTRYRQHPDSNPEASGHLSGDLIVL